MSHQTGISSAAELKDVFANARTNGDIRTIKVSIVDEQMVCSTCVNKQSDSWQDDFDDSTVTLLENDQPCYLLVQLSKKDEWVLITFSPDNATTREKMIYAGTRATLKSEFGGTYIVDEMFTTDHDEVTLSYYNQHTASKNAPPPLTAAEEELKDLKDNEEKTAHGVTTQQKLVGGIAFPLTNDADSALNDFKQGNVNHVELNIDLDKEIIYKMTAKNVSPSDFHGMVSTERAAYLIYKYAHRHNDEDTVSTFFIYSMPGYSISVKERMLYSSCKGPLIDTLESVYNIQIDRKVECDTNDELTEDFLYNEVHPVVNETRRAFSKPKAPGRKGPSRRPRRPAAQAAAE